MVGVELLRSKLENMKLAPFRNNVNDMCTEIEDLVHRIEGLGQKCESIQRYTLNALTSGPNDRFNKYIERIADDIDSGTGANKDLDWESIIVAARTKYTNMEATSEWDAVDPRSAQMLALTTRIKELENSKMTTWKGETGGHQNNSSFKIEEWRLTKTHGETVQRDGKQWWWCPRHNEGKGMYVRHPPGEHDEWHAAKKSGNTYLPPDYRRDKPSEKSNDEPPKNSSVPSKTALELKDSLREVLCTNLCMSYGDVDKLFEHAEQA